MRKLRRADVELIIAVLQDARGLTVDDVLLEEEEKGKAEGRPRNGKLKQKKTTVGAEASVDI
jgi:hypothetical protein